MDFIKKYNENFDLDKKKIESTIQDSWNEILEWARICQPYSMIGDFEELQGKLKKFDQWYKENKEKIEEQDFKEFKFFKTLIDNSMMLNAAIEMLNEYFQVEKNNKK